MNNNSAKDKPEVLADAQNLDNITKMKGRRRYRTPAAVGIAVSKHSPPQYSPTAQKTKRRRCSSDLNITDLPGDGLRLIADYLPKTSRALLALAMTTDSASWRDINWNRSTPTLTSFLRGEKQQRPLAASRALLLQSCAGGDAHGQLWEHVDFVDIRDIASRLSDDDLAGFLMCINAIQKLKTLKLTGLINITGRGLAPLRGSIVLEQLDLSLVALNQSTKLYPEPCLTDTAVIPILESILIDQEDHNLKYLQFPNKWTKWKPRGLLNHFIMQYNETEYRKNICCLKCGRKCEDALSPNGAFRFGTRLDGTAKRGIIQHSCYGCLKHYCSDCHNYPYSKKVGPMLTFCSVCEKEFCAICIRNDSSHGMIQCTGGKSGRMCHNYVCMGCSKNGYGKFKRKKKRTTTRCSDCRFFDRFCM